MSNEERKALVPGKPRFQVIYISNSAHCCFQATVLDTETREPYSTAHNPCYLAVCECFEPEDADRIAAALNKEI